MNRSVTHHILRRSLTRCVLVVCAFVLTGCVGMSAQSGVNGNTGEYQGTEVKPPVVLTDWTFTSSTGEPLSLHDLKGRPVLLFFGYTSCPDVCPTTLGEFKQVKQQLGDAAEQVAFVFISVDAPRDTPETLARYVRAFDSSFIGVAGDDAELERVGKDYGLYYKRNAPKAGETGYMVDHPGTSYLIDREGQLRVLYSFGTEAQVMSAGVRRLLAES
jgi:protein SCO1